MKLKICALLLGTICSAATPAEASPRPDLKAVVGFNSGCGAPGQESFLVGALLSAVIGPLVKTGVNALGSALQSAAAPDEASVSGHTSVMFFNVTDSGTKKNLAIQQSCVVVAVQGTSADGSFNKTRYPQPIGEMMSAAGFRWSPSFLMASKIEVSADKTAWRLIPALLQVGTPLTTDSWARGNGRDLVATFIVASPGAKEDDGVVATRAIKIDRYLISTASQPVNSGLDYLATGWMPLPQPGQEMQAALAAASKRLSDRDALAKSEADAEKKAADVSLPLKDRQAAQKTVRSAQDQLKSIDAAIADDHAALQSAAPVTIKVVVDETRDGNKFLAAVGKFLSDNSDAISKPIAQRLDPTAYTAAQITAASAVDKLHIDAITAVAAWKDSVASGDPIPKQRVAKIQAQAACRALILNGFAEPDCLEVQ